MDQARANAAEYTQRQGSVWQLAHGAVGLPTFMPDATLGVVRALDATDLERCGVEAIVMNTFHLMQRPGSSTIAALGGLHAMSAWRHPIVTDSGGFQAYSLIQQNEKFGSLDEDGITFKPEGVNRKFHLTPEKAIQLQMSYGSDVVMCLDYCTHVDASPAVQEEAVLRTIAWARRCKNEFQRLVEQKRLAPGQRPLLFAVIQGGADYDLRWRCADALLEIGFDGFGYGGWPLDNQGRLLDDLIGYTRSLVPPRFPMHALGVGHPESIMACAGMGYDIFDSAMPTRDARHGRLYAFTDASSPLTATNGGRWFSYIYASDDRYIKADYPVSSLCDCLCCSHYTLGYLHHLFKINDSLFLRLATVHNLTFMSTLTRRLRESHERS